MLKINAALFLAFWLMSSPLLSFEAAPKAQDDVQLLLKEQEVITEHSITIKGKTLPYQAIAGTYQLKDEQGPVKASFFYTAYKVHENKGSKPRPIAFCFNGGPGSSSVWLHMGIIGPKRVSLVDEVFNQPPSGYVDNEFSLLDVADLVFIDPVSTGYSRAAAGEDLKQFHGVDEDVKWMSEFVRLFVTRHDRWDSPKFLIGESYGTVRAVAMASYLQEEMRMYLNGIVLISCILDFQTMDKLDRSNDLPYVLYLPTYTATAWYHKKLSPELQQDLKRALKESEEFAINEYSVALLKGNLLSLEKRQEIAAKLSDYTGLSSDYIKESDLRITIFRFAKELLRKENLIVGRFDSRYLGIDSDKLSEFFEYDPSFNAFLASFTSAFNQYVRADLKWKQDENYRILAEVDPWNYGKARNKYLSLSGVLADTMIQNPSLHVFVGSGYYDLATPYFCTEYSLNHLNLPRPIDANLTVRRYHAGHMMYVHPSSLVKMSDDLHDFFTESLTKATVPTGL